MVLGVAMWVKLTPSLQLYEASNRLRLFLILGKKILFIDDGRAKPKRDRDTEPKSESKVVKWIETNKVCN